MAFFARATEPPPEQPIVSSLAKIARHFKVSERTANSWRARGMPGSTGHYDLAEIEAWRAREGVGQTKAGPREELFRIRAEREQIELDQLLGRLVPLDPVCRLLTRHIHEARALLDQLPDRLIAILPPRTSAEVRRRTRDLAASVVDAACDSLADAMAAPEVTAVGEPE